MSSPEIRVHNATFPQRPNFSGHETFTFRYPWLKKGVDGLKANASIFQTEEAIVELGVGKNMVASIRHWSLATRMIEEKEPEPGERRRGLGVSELARKLLNDRGWDPFLEDDATLWLLHWLLTSNRERATTWFFTFHVLREPEFTRASLLEELLRVAEENKWERVSKNTLESDISCFIRTYVAVKRGANSTLEDSLDCPLTNLGLVHADEKGERFRFNSRPKASLPPAIFAFALADFWERQRDSQNTLSVREIVHGVGSPGRAFRLNEDIVLSYLDKLTEVTKGGLTFEDTTLVRQVVRNGNVRPLTLLRGYYRDNE